MTLLSDLLSNITNVVADAASFSATASSKASTAMTTTPTAPGCLEGLAMWDEAVDAAAQSSAKAGEASGLFETLLGLSTSGLAGNIPTSTQLADALAQRDSARDAATAARSAIDDAAPLVLAAHDSCILGTVVQPIIDCVTTGTQRVTDATATIVAQVSTMISNAVQAVPTRVQNCNEGVDMLTQALALVDAAEAAADVAALNGCITELTTALPASPLIGQATTAAQQATAALDAARALVNDVNSPQIRQIWLNRLSCSVGQTSIFVHLTDESGDDFGDDGVTDIKVTVSNFLLGNLVTIPTPVPVDENGRVSIASVPTVPFPLPLPAGAPPFPPDLPIAGSGQSAMSTVLSLNASRGSSFLGHASAPVSPTGLINIGTINIPVPDTSPTS
jgi:hypothetical protein